MCRKWARAVQFLNHESMLFAVMGHKDDVAVGSPDESCQFEGVERAGGGWLNGWHLVRFNTTQLNGGVQHPDASQQGRVHLPEGDMAVFVRVGSEIASIRGKRNRRNWSFMAVNILAFSSANVVQGDRPETRSHRYSMAAFTVTDHVESTYGWKALLQPLLLQ